MVGVGMGMGAAGVLTSPSVACSCRSLRPPTVTAPWDEVTSTPRGAPMVRVRVGDSSLEEPHPHPGSGLPFKWFYYNTSFQNIKP